MRTLYFAFISLCLSACHGSAPDFTYHHHEPVAVVSNRDLQGDFSDEIRVGWVSGVENINDTLRLYYSGGTQPGGMVFIETVDMENWTSPTPVSLPDEAGSAMGIFYHNGWKAYGRAREMSGLHLFSSPDGIHFDYTGWAFDWKMDTLYSMFWDPFNEEYRAYGRVRGGNQRDEGGWGDDEPVGRRGISLHSNPTWSGNWQNKGQIIADPKDYWDYNGKIRPEFYVPNVFVDGDRYRAFTAVMFNDTARVITNYRNRGPESTRLTGPVYPIELESNDGIHFTRVNGDKPVIPLNPHLRYSQHNPPWYGEDNTEPTCPDCYEVGQLYPFGRIIKHNENRYIFYFYRDDTHYENPSYQTLERAIYVLKIP